MTKFSAEFCEGTYIQPTFITDYPVEMSPLTKMHRSKPGLTERFELMVNGKELANAYSELNDPIDQEERFKEQMRLADKGDDEAMIIDQDFLRSLQYGMPPTSGIGIGIDRLVMLMTGQTTIQEVLFFPQMRPEKVVKERRSRQIYGTGYRRRLGACYSESRLQHRRRHERCQCAEATPGHLRHQ